MSITFIFTCKYYEHIVSNEIGKDMINDYLFIFFSHDFYRMTEKFRDAVFKFFLSSFKH